MELKVEQLCGRNYATLEDHSTIVTKSLLSNGSLPFSRGICWNPLTRNLLVCDTAQCCVHAIGVVFSPDENGNLQMSLTNVVIATFGSHGSLPGQFLHPVAVTVSLQGKIAVADGKLNRVQIFSGSGDFAHSFGRPGTGRGEFRGMCDLKFVPRGHIAIVDAGNDRIQIMTATGIVVHIVGRYGWKLGELMHPSAIAVNAGGDLFVCDQGNQRIQRFSGVGRALLEWGSRRGPIPDPSITTNLNVMVNAEQKPAIFSIFDTPCDLVLGLHGEVIVCDSGKRQLLIFSDVGTCLHVVNTPHNVQSSIPSAVTICLSVLVALGRPPKLKQTQFFSSEETATEGEGSQDSDSSDYLLVAFSPMKRVRLGHFEPLPVLCVVAITSCLTYADAVHLRLVCRYFHHVCRRLRNQWKLFPFTTGHATVKKYNRIVSPATGLVAVEEAFEKWGLRIFKPANNIRKHVMDFRSGFCRALSTLYGPLFCYQHENILLALFQFYAGQSKSSPTVSVDKEEIDKAAFIEIVTQIEEVRAGFRTWEQCSPFARDPTNSRRVEMPIIRTTQNVRTSVGGFPLQRPIQLVENAQQHQLSKLLQKLQSL